MRSKLSAVNLGSVNYPAAERIFNTFLFQT